MGIVAGRTVDHPVLGTTEDGIVQGHVYKVLSMPTSVSRQLVKFEHHKDVPASEHQKQTHLVRGADSTGFLVPAPDITSFFDLLLVFDFDKTPMLDTLKGGIEGTIWSWWVPSDGALCIHSEVGINSYAAGMTSVSQTVLFDGLAPSSYNGPLKAVYDMAFGIALKIYTGSKFGAPSWIPGCHVSSLYNVEHFAARRVASVTFTAYMPREYTEAAFGAAKTLRPDVFVKSITQANKQLRASVPTPPERSVLEVHEPILTYGAGSAATRTVAQGNGEGIPMHQYNAAMPAAVPPRRRDKVGGKPYITAAMPVRTQLTEDGTIGYDGGVNAWLTKPEHEWWNEQQLKKTTPGHKNFWAHT